MATIISGDTGIDKITDGSVVAADISTGAVGATQLASTLDLSGKTITLATDAVDQLSTASGSAPSYSARAWVNFDGTGTVAIRSSGNVSSITDHGVGAYTINFTTAMPDANYVAVGSAAQQDAVNNDVDFLVTYSSNLSGDATYTVSNPTTSSFRIFISGAAGTVSAVDSSIVTYAVFR